MTGVDYARLEELRAWAAGRSAPAQPMAPPAEEDRPGFFARAGMGFANIPGNVLGGLATLGDYALTGGENASAGTTTIPNVSTPPPAQGWKENIADIIPGAAQMIGEMYALGPIGRGALLAAGARPLVARIGGEALAGATIGAMHSPQNPLEEAAITGGEFGAMGAISELIPGGGARKIIARGLLNAAIPPASAAIRGEDPFTQQTGIQSAAQGILGSGVIGATRRLFRRSPAAEATSPTAPEVPRPPSVLDPSQELLDPDALRLASGPRPSVPWAQQFDTPSNIAPSAEMAASGQRVIRPTTEMRLAELPTMPLPVEGPRGRWETGARPPVHPAMVDIPELRLRGATEPASLIPQGTTAQPKRLFRRAVGGGDPLPNRTIEEASRAGDLVTIGGQRGKLVLRDDGTYFRRAQSNEEARVFGNVPNAYLHEIEGLGLEKIGTRSGEARTPFNREITASRNRLGMLPPEAGISNISAPVKKTIDDALMLSKGDRAKAADMLERMAAGAAPEQTGNIRLAIKELRNGGFASPAYLTRLGGAIAGGVTGYSQDPEETGVPRWLMALFVAGSTAGAAVNLRRALLRRKQPQEVAGILPTQIRRLFPKAERKAEQAAAGQEGLRPSIAGKAARFVEKNVVGQSPDIQTAKELGSGYKELQTQRAAEVLPKVTQFKESATPAQLKAYENFKSQPWTMASEANLRSAAGKDADSLLEMRRIEQDVQAAYKEADPTRRGKLIDDTLGTYETRSFRAFLDPKRWIKDLRSNPKLEDDITNYFSKQSYFAGMSPPQIKAAVQEYGREIRMKSEGSKFTPGAGSQKISEYLYTARKDLSPEVKAFLGEVTNPVERTALTLIKLVNHSAQAKSISEMMKLKDELGNPLVVSAEQQRAAMASATASGNTALAERIANYKPIESEGFGAMKGLYAPREILDALNVHNDALKTNRGWLNTLNNVVKWSFTAGNLPTHAHNWMQIVQQGLTARVYNPLKFVEAASVLKDKRDAYRKMVRLGMVSSDFASSELRQPVKVLEDMLSSKRTVGKTIRSAGRVVNNAYGLPDWLVRTAAYLENEPRYLERGKAAGLSGKALEEFAEKETVKFVNRYTINYRNVLGVVKWARNLPVVSPFVSYTAGMAKILKNLAEDALTGSGTDRAWAVLNLGQLLAAPLALSAAATAAMSKEDQREWEKVQKLSPAYAKGQIRVPLGKDEKGNFRYFNLGPVTPAGDFAKLLDNLAHGDAEAIVAANPILGLQKSPAINIASGLATGRDPFTRESLDTAGKKLGYVARNVVPPLTPVIGSESKRIGRAFSRNEEGGLGITDSRTGRRDTPSDILRTQLGARTSTVNLKSLMLSRKLQAQDQEAEAKRELRRILRSDANTEVKEKARRKFMQRRQEIRESLK